MGRKNKKKRRLSENERAAGDAATNKIASIKTSNESGHRQEEPDTKKSSIEVSSNLLLCEQTAFLKTLTETERNSFFCNASVDPDRRAEIWMLQADVGEQAVLRYSWATPDDRALLILKHFSPLIEIGCGANAYWCRQMVKVGVDVVGYDLDPSGGGRILHANSEHCGGGAINTDKPGAARDFVVQKGGPEVLGHKKHSKRILFLCYPDEDDAGGDEEGQPSSMGLSCLEFYKGDYVIHVGESFRDTTLSMEQAPWGRSSSPEFQQLLATEFHCVLHVGLSSNWLHTRDSLSVWKRSETCTLVFAAEGEDDQDEEVHYRHVPAEEQLPTDLAAPCLQHLLVLPRECGSLSASLAREGKPNQSPPHASTQSRSAPGSPRTKKRNKKKKGATAAQTDKTSTATNKATAYECPW